MRYVGGKSRIAKHIEGVILARRGHRQRYVELFIGGGAVLARIAPHFEHVRAGDVSPDLVLMWQAVAQGWTPPTEVDDTMYAYLRDAEPSAIRGFVGFGCSFGGKWFGGRARGGKMADGSPRNHAAESARAVARIAQGIRGASIAQRDYRDWAVDANTVIYCDPPYADTQGYAAAGAFDSAEFWSVAEKWHRTGALVVVSEYSAPEGWVPVVEKSHRQSLQNGRDGRPKTTEYVWVHGGSV